MSMYDWDEVHNSGDIHFPIHFLQEPIEEDTWETKDGKKLKYSEMSTHHLLNTIKLIRRSTRGDETIITSRMRRELRRRK